MNGIATCSAVQLAEDDWFRWLQDVNTQLPGAPTATIATAAPSPALTRYIITLSWPETGQAAPSTYTLVTQQ